MKILSTLKILQRPTGIENFQICVLGSSSVPSVLDMQCVWTEHVCSSLDLLYDNAWLKAGGQRSSLAGAGDTTHPYKCTETSAVHSHWISGWHTNKQMSLFNLRGIPKVKCTFWNNTNVVMSTREIQSRFNHSENDTSFLVLLKCVNTNVDYDSKRGQVVHVQLKQRK